MCMQSVPQRRYPCSGHSYLRRPQEAFKILGGEGWAAHTNWTPIAASFSENVILARLGVLPQLGWTTKACRPPELPLEFRAQWPDAVLVHAPIIPFSAGRRTWHCTHKYFLTSAKKYFCAEASNACRWGPISLPPPPLCLHKRVCVTTGPRRGRVCRLCVRPDPTGIYNEANPSQSASLL